MANPERDLRPGAERAQQGQGGRKKPEVQPDAEDRQDSEGNQASDYEPILEACPFRGPVGHGSLSHSGRTDQQRITRTTAIQTNPIHPSAIRQFWTGAPPV
jgi:hypothetical protein